MGIAVVGLASVSGQGVPTGDPDGMAKGLHQLFMHDACTSEYPPQPDTRIHKQLIEKVVTAVSYTHLTLPTNREV